MSKPMKHLQSVLGSVCDTDLVQFSKVVRKLHSKWGKEIIKVATHFPSLFFAIKG